MILLWERGRITGMGSSMIYLFNSAIRPLYKGNLLATLFLPYGWTNEYRYSCSTQRRNVSEDFIDDVKKLWGKEDAVIVFINRFGKDASNNDAYEYYPIRRARFLSYCLDGQQLYARVLSISGMGHFLN